MSKVEFCTCHSFDCPNHPNNHDQGCTPCIEKNLKFGEVPSCIFDKVRGDEKPENYYYEDFAKMVMKNK